MVISRGIYWIPTWLNSVKIYLMEFPVKEKYCINFLRFCVKGFGCMSSLRLEKDWEIIFISG